jgi:hypothetical protein
MSPDFLQKFLEKYREMPVLWQVRSTDYSNRTKRDEAWDLLVQLNSTLFRYQRFYFCNQLPYVFIWHSQVVFVVFRTIISNKIQ